MLEPLTIKDISPRTFLTLLSRGECIRYHLRKKLKMRDAWEVFLSWQRYENLESIAEISKIIASTDYWPNALFIPQDEVQYIFSDFNGTLSGVHIMQALEKNFLHKEISWTFLYGEMTYTEMVSNLLIQKNQAGT